jgi:hypothetical protein
MYKTAAPITSIVKDWTSMLKKPRSGSSYVFTCL